MPVFVHEERGSCSYWRFVGAPDGVNVVFSTRTSGVSGPPYDSLNLGYHVKDRPDLVAENRVIIASALNIDPRRITSPRQRHTAVVSLLEPAAVGSGAVSENSPFDPCDGLVTKIKQAPILMHFADCAPVVLAGKSNASDPAIAVLHAGRRGLEAGVLAAGVRRLEKDFDISPESLVAAIGPAIGACCYEVGEDIATGFASRFGPALVRRENIRPRLDLRGAVKKTLLTAGLQAQQIHLLDICTCCDQDFYSYRRDGLTGRHAAIAWIE